MDVKSPTFEDIFYHLKKKLIIEFDDNFEYRMLLSSREKIFSLDKFPSFKQYCLPKQMKDSEMQNTTLSTLMDENMFWGLLYYLFVVPELGKKILNFELSKDKNYICHIEPDSKRIFSIEIDWRKHKNIWYLEMSVFDFSHPRRPKSIFIY